MQQGRRVRMDKCSCGGTIKVIYFRDKDGKSKPDYAICTDCLRCFTVGDWHTSQEQ